MRSDAMAESSRGAQMGSMLQDSSVPSCILISCILIGRLLNNILTMSHSQGDMYKCAYGDA